MNQHMCLQVSAAARSISPAKLRRRPVSSVNSYLTRNCLLLTTVCCALVVRLPCNCTSKTKTKRCPRLTSSSRSSSRCKRFASLTSKWLTVSLLCPFTQASISASATAAGTDAKWGSQPPSPAALAGSRRQSQSLPQQPQTPTSTAPVAANAAQSAVSSPGPAKPDDDVAQLKAQIAQMQAREATAMQRARELEAQLKGAVLSRASSMLNIACVISNGWPSRSADDQSERVACAGARCRIERWQHCLVCTAQHSFA
mgnify:CR=1 FL=1